MEPCPSPDLSSSFRSGANRIQGTLLGSIFGFYCWRFMVDSYYHSVLLSLWVFFCGISKSSVTYGEVMMSAALTVGGRIQASPQRGVIGYLVDSRNVFVEGEVGCHVLLELSS